MAVTVSIGVATAQAPTSVDQLIARADAALYFAKEGGRNRVTIAASDGTVDFPTTAPGLALSALAIP
jgi:predicted signal transduction protein with EAL and GGDEF domain